MSVEIRFDGVSRGAVRAASETVQAIGNVKREAQASARAEVEAAVKKQQALRESIVAYRQEASAAARGSREQVAAAHLAVRAEKQLAASIGVTRAEQASLARSTAAAELSLGRAARGAVAGSGVFSHLGRAVAFASTSFLGAYGFAKVVEASVGAAEDLNIQLERSRKLFGEHSSGVEAWSKTTVHAIGLARDQSLKYANDLGTMLRGMGVSEQESARISVDAVKRVADIAALHHADVEQVMSAYQAALAGRTRGLKQYGIVIDQAAIKEEAYRLGLVKTTVDSAKVTRAREEVAIATAKLAKAEADYGPGTTQVAAATLSLEDKQKALAKALAGSTGAVSNNAKAQAVAALVMAKSASAAGGFADKSKTLDGRLKILRAEGRELEVTLGQALIPAITQLVRHITDWLEKGNNLQRLQHGIRTAVHDVVTVVKTFYGWAHNAADAVGGWKHALELLIALKVVGWIAGVKRSIDLLIGSRAAGGLIGAEASAGGLLGRLKLLKGLGPITVAVSVVDSLVNPAPAGYQQPVTIRGKTYIKGTPEYYAALGIPAPDYLPGRKTSVAPAPGVTTGDASSQQRAIVATAQTQIGVPYKAGNVDVGWNIGEDCSLFVMNVMARNGIHVGRTTYDQFAGGTPIGGNEPLQPGDLVFFNTHPPNPGHVGIYMGNGNFIHSPHTGDVVKISSLWDGYYRDHYAGARRYVTEQAQSPPSKTPADQGPRKPGTTGGVVTTSGDTTTTTTTTTPTTPTIPDVVVGTKTTPPKPGGVLDTAAYKKLETVFSLAQLTKKTADDLAALTAMRGYLKTALGKATGDRRKEIADALAGVQSDIETINKDIADKADKVAQKRKAALKVIAAKFKAGDAEIMQSIRRDVAEAKQSATARKLGREMLDVLSGLPANAEVDIRDRWGRVIGKLDAPELAARIRAAMRKLQAALAGGTLKARHAAEAEIQRLSQTLPELVTAAADRAAQAAQARQGALEAAFGRLGSRLLAAFDRETQRNLTDMQQGLTARLSAMQKAYQAKVTALQRETEKHLAEMQRRSAAAIAKVEASGAQLTPAEQALAALQSSHDAAQTAQDLADAQKALADAQTGGDPAAIADAQRRLDDLLYQQQVADLQKRADAERKARDEQTAAKVQQLQDDEQRREKDYSDQQAQLEQSLQDEENAREEAARTEEANREQEYQDARDSQRTELEDELAAWQANLVDRSKTWADFVTWLQGKGQQGVFGAQIPDPVSAMKQAGKKQGSAFANAYIDELNKALDAYNSFVAQTGGSPPSSTNVGGTGVGPGSTSLVVPGMAGGGKVPGRFVGRQDSVVYRLTPGENVTDRELSQKLEAFLDRGGRPAPVVNLHVTAIGTTPRQIWDAIARETQPGLDRVIRYPSP